MTSVMVILAVVVSWLIFKPFMLGEIFPATSRASEENSNDDLDLDYSMNKLSQKEYEELRSAPK